MKTYTVHIPFMAGGSYAMGDNLEDTIRRAFQFFISDWGSIFAIHGQDIVAEVKGGPTISLISVRIPEAPKANQSVWRGAYLKKIEKAIAERTTAA